MNLDISKNVDQYTSLAHSYTIQLDAKWDLNLPRFRLRCPCTGGCTPPKSSKIPTEQLVNPSSSRQLPAADTSTRSSDRQCASKRNSLVAETMSGADDVELPTFVQPRHFLQPQPIGDRTQPSLLDQEQLAGLVSTLFAVASSICPFYTACVIPSMSNGARGTCSDAARGDLVTDFLLFSTACDPSFPQSQDELRCTTSQLPPHRVRHIALGEEELEHPHPEW